MENRILGGSFLVYIKQNLKMINTKLVVTDH